MIKFTVDTTKLYLSNESQIYKTETFLKETRRFSEMDFVIEKIGETVIKELKVVEKELTQRNADNAGFCFKATTVGAEHSFYFIFGAQQNENSTLTARDIVFYKFVSTGVYKQRNDQRLVEFLQTRNEFSIDIQIVRQNDTPDYKKIYRLSNMDGVNFPLLNAQQKKLVELEDENVLVQGVAGSGKTNICIDKIVYVACRGYSGRTLYTTFSRGLLIDSKEKLGQFSSRLKKFCDMFRRGDVVFSDKEKKRAVEAYLGIYFREDDAREICTSIEGIVAYIDNKVDFYLPQDLYNKYLGKDAEIVGENYFVRTYLKNIKNHNLKNRFSKLNLSAEIIYKEIYGLIFGCFDISAPKDKLSLNEYINARKDSFERVECEVIYALAMDYETHMRSAGLTDNNFISRLLMGKISDKYSLTIVDEAQDMTEVNLCLLKTISRKMFCVGDALQMINPSYFSFSYLKRLLYEKDIVSVKELSNNYRNTKKIADIVEKLGDLNVKCFGTHSFVLRSESVDDSDKSVAVYVDGTDFITEVSKGKFDNFTVIVTDASQKESLRRVLKNQEILTVSEIKGLERETVVLYNLLSDNIDKWKALQRMIINRKTADENSVFRYYFNLFYVGISRAKTNIYVYEKSCPDSFKEFFKTCFSNKDVKQTIASLSDVVSRVEIEQEEILDNIAQFIKLGQYDNARFATNRIIDGLEKNRQSAKIDVDEEFVSKGKYREAGVRFWELGLISEAKTQFRLSKDDVFIDLIDACANRDSAKLDVNIVDFYEDVKNNETAKELILRSLKNDLNEIKEKNSSQRRSFKEIKEKKYGK